jgi:hypothetical protein
MDRWPSSLLLSMDIDGARTPDAKCAHPAGSCPLHPSHRQPSTALIAAPPVLPGPCCPCQASIINPPPPLVAPSTIAPRWPP